MKPLAPRKADIGPRKAHMASSIGEGTGAMATQNSAGCADPYLQAHGSVFANTDQYFLFRLCTKF